jgi:hypothetical protein
MNRSAKSMVLVCGLAAGALSVADRAQAQQFSADLVNITAAGEGAGAPGRLTAAGGRARIETPELPGSYLIVDADAPAAYLVRPAQRIFMEARQSSRLTQLFVRLDPDDPCRQWQVMAEVAGVADRGHPWTCELNGRGVLDGRDVVKFETTFPRQGRSGVWIDPRLRFPIRVETADGVVVALTHINEGPQAADELVIPANYRKFDPLQLIERIKQSDVWVEPPR